MEFAYEIGYFIGWVLSRGTFWMGMSLGILLSIWLSE